jgi:hypothetical protein
MQAFAILLLAVNLAFSALAAPMADGTISMRSSYGNSNPYGAFDPNFLCGPQVGEGGFINHSILV